MTKESHYTFGDSDLAARRLRALAAAYHEPSRSFLARRGPRGAPRAVDLGSGPGHTTLLVHGTLAAGHTTGIDRSSRYLDTARAEAPEGVSFVEHDLTRAPFPVEPAGVLFCRFLLTHLPEPARVLEVWRGLAERGGRLLVQEAASLEAEHPALRRYYELVGELQAHYGQALHIGRQLADLARGTSWKTLSFEVRVIEQPARVMAELHLLNLPTWRTDPFARERFDQDELDDLERALARLSSGVETTGPVRAGLGELVLEA